MELVLLYCSGTYKNTIPYTYPLWLLNYTSRTAQLSHLRFYFYFHQNHTRDNCNHKLVQTDFGYSGAIMKCDPVSHLGTNTIHFYYTIYILLLYNIYNSKYFCQISHFRECKKAGKIFQKFGGPGNTACETIIIQYLRKFGLFPPHHFFY